MTTRVSKNYRNMSKAELIKALEALERQKGTPPKGTPPAPEPPSDSYERVLHALQVHQAELEAQNEALRSAQSQIEESRNRYAELYDFAPLGYVTLSHAGLIQEINLTGATMLGVERTNLVGKPFVQYVARDDKNVFLDHLVRSLQASGLTVSELYLTRKDGATLYVELHSAPIKVLNGEEAGLLTALTDITNRKRAEDARETAEAEVMRLNRDLERRATQLAIANNELESFSYSVSHDLRAPLAQIESFLDTLVEESFTLLPPESQHYLTLIHQNALAMRRLIDDLLVFSRTASQPLKKQPVSTSELLYQVVSNLKSAEPNRMVEVTIGDLPPCQADPILLTQVWTNLLSNAFKFTSKRAEPRIEVGSFREADETIYFVRDNGVGFDMEQANRLFQVFQRLHGEDEYPGTGVGLAIVERVVRRHGGRVWAEAEPDRGAAFFFTLA